MSSLLACLVVLVAVFVVPLGVRLLRVTQLPTEAWLLAGLVVPVGLAQPPGAAGSSGCCRGAARARSPRPRGSAGCCRSTRTGSAP